MHKQLVQLADGRRVIAKFTNPQPLTERLSASTADFRDAGDRVTLGHLGVFSTDRPAHRAARQFEAHRQARIADAYCYLGLDQRAEYRRIAGEVQALGLVPDGCWPRSTGAYASRRDALDRETLAAEQRIRASERYFIEIAGDEVCVAAFSLGA